MSYKNYSPWLFIILMHLAINVYLDEGKPGTSGGTDIRHASQPVVETFDYCQYYTQGVGTFFLTRDAILEWTLRKPWFTTPVA